MKLINGMEQIEKMAKERREIKDIMKLLDKCVSLNPMCKSEVANVLYGNNYRKIPEDSVVLSMEEYKKLKGSYKGEKYYEKEDEKTENVLRGKPQGVEYEASVVLNADSKHKAYLQYLSRWIFEHYEDEFQGCSPAGYDEWLDNEGDDGPIDEEDAFIWRVSYGEYELAEDGGIILDSTAASVFSVGELVKVVFEDEEDQVGIYRVVKVTDTQCICEFVK